MGKLTDRTIKAAKAAAKAFRVWDGDGLYVEVAPSGAKLFRVKYRVAGKEKRLALGTYPEVSLGEAREMLADARKLLRRGEDPGQAKANAKAKANATDTFEAIARAWHETVKGSLVEAHASRQLRRIEANVFPYVGSRSIDSITAAEWLAVLRRVEARGAIETAHRIRSICEQVYRHARAEGRASPATRPLDDIRDAMKPAPDNHYAAVTEPTALKPILLMLDGYVGSTIVRTALLLAPHVFVRPGNLRAMEWAEVDLDDASWTIPKAKIKGAAQDLIVPLSRQSLALLRDLQPLTGGGRFVFPSPRGDDRCISDNTLNAGLKRLGISTADEMTVHGWRATARTMLDELLEFRPDWIEHQLGHVVRDPNGRAYNRTAFLVKRREMMQVWSDFLDSVRKGEKKVAATPTKAKRAKATARASKAAKRSTR